LEKYTRLEPLPFASFYVGRARALAALGGERSQTAGLAAELKRLLEDGERLGIRIALPAINAAITATGNQ
jgi:hypothetical protein